MTTRQIKAAARQIPFNPDVPLPEDIRAGLERIVERQLLGRALGDHRVYRRTQLRRETGL